MWSDRKMHPLAPGYTAEVDVVDEPTWGQLLRQFKDANIYQTWSYAAVMCGERDASHLVVKEKGKVVAIAQARIAKVPFVNIGVAYIHWGPLWRLHTEVSVEVFQQAIRALRNEYVCKRGLALRMFPAVVDDDTSGCALALAEEEFHPPSRQTGGRTILMDLSPSLQELREGMGGNFRRNLKLAERPGLEVLEGSSEDLFESFVAIYKEMVSRKNFLEPNDIAQFRSIQAQLPEEFKMKIMLCKSDNRVCSGAICSSIGDTAIYLFGATSNDGMKSRGSYLLHWKLIEKLKHDGVAIYNLNGINPEKNPGTYKFKSDLAGKNGQDVHYVGRVDSHPGLISRSCIEFGDHLRGVYQAHKARFKNGQTAKPEPKTPTKEPEESEVAAVRNGSPVAQTIPRNESVIGH